VAKPAFEPGALFPVTIALLCPYGHIEGHKAKVSALPVRSLFAEEINWKLLSLTPLIRFA
jgi:hypothetical protein